MKTLIFISPLLLLWSCGNEVEEITDPRTGTVLKKYEYYTDDAGQKVKDGTYTEWKPNGDISWTCNYKDGKLHGEEIVYAKPDSIIYNNYENDVRSGRCRIEYKGVIIRDLNYSNGMLNGKQQYYFPDGKINIVGFMKDNKTSNTWKHYDPEGDIVATFTYNANGAPNELVGKWVEINNDGKEIYYVFDKQGYGEFHAPFMDYSKKATLQLKGQYQLGTNLVLRDDLNTISMSIMTFDKDEIMVMFKNGNVGIYQRER